MSNIVSLVEHNHLTEMHASLKRKLAESQKKDQTRMDTLRASILNMVVIENYEGAREELEKHVARRSAYPGFQARAERYVQHCSELIHAVQTKRNFPGLASLSLAKQQEVHEKVLQHFDELKRNLKHIERVEREQRLNDMRSTVWVVRTAAQVVALIVATAFFVDLKVGMFSSAIKVVDHTVEDATTWIVSLAGF